MAKFEFECACGQRLRARRESAGRLTMCPRCREPVAIPRLEPNHRGVEALSLSLAGGSRGGEMGRGHTAERQASRPSATKRAEDRGSKIADRRSRIQDRGSKIEARDPRSSILDPRPDSQAQLGNEKAGNAGQPVRRPRRRKKAADEHTPIRLRRVPRWMLFCGPALLRRRTDPLELNLGLFPLLAGTAAGLTAGSAVVLALLPGTMQASGRDAGPLWTALLLFTGLWLLCAAYACSFLGQALGSAARGRECPAEGMRRDPAYALKMLAGCFGCFLAGPVLPAAGCLWYWIHCGELTWLDGIILAELGIAANGYWTLAVLVVSASGRFRDAAPDRALQTIAGLGRRAVAIVLLAGVLFGLHGLLLVHAATKLHTEPGIGILLLAALWCSVLFIGGAAARLAGRWSFDRQSSAASLLASTRSPAFSKKPGF